MRNLSRFDAELSGITKEFETYCVENDTVSDMDWINNSLKKINDILFELVQKQKKIDEKRHKYTVCCSLLNDPPTCCCIEVPENIRESEEFEDFTEKLENSRVFFCCRTQKTLCLTSAFTALGVMSTAASVCFFGFNMIQMSYIAAGGALASYSTDSMLSQYDRCRDLREGKLEEDMSLVQEMEGKCLKVKFFFKKLKHIIKTSQIVEDFENELGAPRSSARIDLLIEECSQLCLEIYKNKTVAEKIIAYSVKKLSDEDPLKIAFLKASYSCDHLQRRRSVVKNDGIPPSHLIEKNLKKISTDALPLPEDRKLPEKGESSSWSNLEGQGKDLSSPRLFSTFETGIEQEDLSEDSSSVDFESSEEEIKEKHHEFFHLLSDRLHIRLEKFHFNGSFIENKTKNKSSTNSSICGRVFKLLKCCF